MVFAGIVVAATALVPRWTIMVSWAAVMLSILLGPLFGAATFQLPESVQNVSPFTHVPKVPAAETTVMPILSLLLVAAGLVAVGVIAFRRRDLALPA
jgi:ABC-2 type transport system permease protein